MEEGSGTRLMDVWCVEMMDGGGTIPSFI